MEHGSRKRGYYETNRTPLEHDPLTYKTAGYRAVKQELVEEREWGEENILGRASRLGYDSAVPVSSVSWDCCKFYGSTNPQVAVIQPSTSSLPVGVWDQPYGAWVQAQEVGSQSRETLINSLPEQVSPTSQRPAPLHRQDEDKSRSCGYVDFAHNNSTNSFSVSRLPISHTTTESAHFQEKDWARSSDNHVAAMAHNSPERPADTEKPIKCGSDIERPITASSSGMNVNSAHAPKRKRPRCKQQRRPAKKQFVKAVPNNPWGDCSYTDLLTMAILSSAENRLTLTEIYDWISDNIPYFKDKKDVSGWKNSIRHVLSIKKRFVRISRSLDGRTQAFRGWWSVDPNSCILKMSQEPERLCACQPHCDDKEGEVETNETKVTVVNGDVML